MSLMASMTKQTADYDFVQVVRILRYAAKQKTLDFSVASMPEGIDREVQSIRYESDSVKISLAMEALAGVKSVIPDYFYEQLLAALHTENDALLDFLNIFNHRYFQLVFVRAQQSHLLLREEYEQQQGKDLTRYRQADAIRSLSALPRDVEGDFSMFKYSVLLGLKTKNLRALQQLLSSYFKLQISVAALSSSHHLLPKTTLSQLSAKGAANNQLGKGMCLGKTCQLHFKSLTVTVEPQTAQEYRKINQDGAFAKKLKETVEVYLREQSQIKLFLYVKRKFLPEPQLSSDATHAVRLGETNCLSPQRKPEEFQKILLQ